MVVALAVLALVVAAGAAAATMETTPSDRRRRPRAAAEEFAAGTTMAELQEEGRDHRSASSSTCRRSGSRTRRPARSRASTSTSARTSPTSSGWSRSSSRRSRTTGSRSSQDGTVDLILSTMTITTDRDAEIDFSRPVLHRARTHPGPGGLGHRGDRGPRREEGLHGDSARRTRRRSEEQAPEAKLELVDTYSRVPRADPERSRSTRCPPTTSSSRGWSSSGRLAEDRRRRLTTEPYGVGITDGDTEFADFVNESIEEIFEDGTWDELTTSGSASTPRTSRRPRRLHARGGATSSSPASRSARSTKLIA